MRQRCHRARTEHPPEPHGQIQQLGDEREAQRQQRVAPQLVAEARADQLVADLLRPAADLGDGPGDLHRLLVRQLLGAYGQAVVAGRLHDGLRETGVGERVAGPVRVDGPLGGVLDQPAAGELHAEVQPPYDDARRGDGQHHGRHRQPAARAPHQLRVAAGEPGAHPAHGGQPRDTGTPVHPAARHRELGEHPCDHQRADHGRQHTDAQRDAETLHRAGRQHEQQRRRDQRGHVGVRDRAERALEAGGQGRPPAGPAAARVLLPGTLEHQHVRVHGHADRQHETGETGQRQRRAEGGETGVGDQAVAEQGHDGEQAHEAVDDDDEQRREGGADHGRPGAGADGLGAQRRADGPLLHRLHRHRQRAAVHEQRELLRLVAGEGTGDLRGPARDARTARHRRVDLRRGDDLVVEDDGHPALRVARRVAGGLTCQPGPALAVLEVDGDVPAGAALRIEAGRGALDVLAAEGGPAEVQQLARLVGQHALSRRELLVAFRARPLDRVHGELRGTAEHVGGLPRVLHAGQLDDDPVVTGADEARFGDAERVDPAAQHLQGAVGGLGVGLQRLGGTGLQHDLGAAPQVQSETDRDGDGDEHGHGDHGKREQRPDAGGTFHKCLQHGTRARRRARGKGKGGVRVLFRCWSRWAAPGPGPPGRARRRAGRDRPRARGARAGAGRAVCTGA